MKELSIEEKARRYDVAVEELRGLLEGIHEEKCDIMEEDIIKIFPELKGNDDERIRKELLNAFQESEDSLYMVLTPHRRESFITWLEKQGEQNFTDKPKFKVGKFKVGDWLTNGQKIRKIIAVGTGLYVIEREDGTEVSLSVNYVERNYHLWTIQDAKDGDVLATENFIFIFKNIDDNNGVHYYCHREICWYENYNQFDIAMPQSLMGKIDNGFSHYSPATKEQRDILFQKMKEAGYEWDAEKKELKKIEKKPSIEMITPEESLGIDSETYNKIVDECIYGEQKPAWSEDDEKILSKIQDHLREFYVDKKGYPYVAEPDSPEMIEANWLKSIKGRILTQLLSQQEWGGEDSPYYDDICEILIDLLHSEFADVNKDFVQKDLDWLKSLKNKVLAQNLTVTDEELAQAKKDAYNDALNKIEYDSENPTFDDGWNAAIWYLKKKNINFQSTWKPSDEQIKALETTIYTNMSTNDERYPVLREFIAELKKLKC